MSLLFLKMDKHAKKSIAIDKLNFHDSDYLKQRMYLEKRRAERGRYYFSIISISWESHVASKRSNHRIDRHKQQMRDLVAGLCRNIRETDVISIYDPDQVIILLPDTTFVHANQVFNRIKDSLILDKPKSNVRDLFDSGNVRIVTYPSDCNGNTAENSSQKTRRLSDIDIQEFISRILSHHPYQIFKTSSLRKSDAIPNSSGDGLILGREKKFHSLLPDQFRCSLKLSIKRILDLCGAALGLAISSPLFIIIAFIIKISSKGPVFFKQHRIGYKGKKFTMLKFRSMREGSSEKPHKDYISKLLTGSLESQNKHKVTKYKEQIDQRITGIGKLLRKTSLDELPQLLNVLWGDMSLVGPRPHPVYEVELYQNWQFRRLLIKPGLTGYSKIKLRCTPEDYNEAMRYDLRYVEQWSFSQDIKILLLTIPSLFSANGAY
ncbi:sugar transferase [candidate division KSB1 bacterium]|nr:sugar transferase [candidate division KSB1 bacterium]